MSFSREPALYLALLQAIIGLVVGFGVNLTNEQMGMIMAVAAAIAAVIVRQNVFAPTSKDGAKLEEVKYVGSAPEAVK
jgi:hypothetical protein